MPSFSPRQFFLDAGYLLHFAFGEGSWRLRSHENSVLDAVLAHVSDDVRALVKSQLQQKYFVERTNKRISVLRYYAPADALRIRDSEYWDLLLRVQIVVDGKKEFAHVTFYKGYLFSVEFKKAGRSYLRSTLTVAGVAQGKPRDSYTRAIDRLEHGRDSE
jgi:hypothetical protein